MCSDEERLKQLSLRLNGNVQKEFWIANVQDGPLVLEGMIPLLASSLNQQCSNERNIDHYPIEFPDILPYVGHIS
jgi:hypothetical protein